MTGQPPSADIPPGKKPPGWRPFAKRIGDTIATEFAIYVSPEILKIPASIVRDGVSRYYGEYVADWLDRRTSWRPARSTRRKMGASVPKPNAARRRPKTSRPTNLRGRCSR
jgi:hypothetical protein